MKALLISTDPVFAPISGIGRYAHHLYTELREIGCDVRVLTLDAVAPDDDEPCRSLDGLDYWTTSLHENLRLVADALSSAELDGVDVVHCQDIYDAAAAHQIARRLGVPLVVTKHFMEGAYHRARTLLPDQLAPEARAIVDRSHQHAMRLERWLLGRASRTIAVSDWVRDEIGRIDRALLSTCVTIRPAGAGPPPLPLHRGQLLDRLDILMPGRLVPIKGGDIAIRAVAALGDQRARLSFAGCGGYADGLRRLASGLGVIDQVHFLGQLEQTEMAGRFQIADMVVAPSRGEAFGLAVAEALAQGCLVIASAAGGILEQITNGVNGLLFPAGDHVALAERIRWAAGHPAEVERIRTTARDRARGMPRWRDVAERVAGEYSALIGRRQAAVHG